MIDLDGFSQTNLTKTPKLEETFPDFSPNGSQMCFTRQSSTPQQPPSGIYVMDIDGSDPILLYEDDYGLMKCDWSPDGKKIAFTTDMDYPSDPEVYVINADGSGLTNLTRNSAVDTDPAWSPDGTKITFASNRDGDFNIYTMNADGSGIAQLTNERYDELDPHWQPLPKIRSETVHSPDTGGTSLILVASALLLAVGRLLYAGVLRRM
jgi:Tol biopolymer transport system component